MSACIYVLLLAKMPFISTVLCVLFLIFNGLHIARNTHNWKFQLIVYLLKECLSSLTVACHDKISSNYIYVKYSRIHSSLKLFLYGCAGNNFSNEQAVKITHEVFTESYLDYTCGIKVNPLLSARIKNFNWTTDNSRPFKVLTINTMLIMLSMLASTVLQQHKKVTSSRARPDVHWFRSLMLSLLSLAWQFLTELPM